VACGISFGNFLIKQVVEDLVGAQQPQDVRYAVAGAAFRAMAGGAPAGEDSTLITGWIAAGLPCSTIRPGPPLAQAETAKPTLMRLAAHYFLNEKTAEGRLIDPVARFHLQRRGWNASTGWVIPRPAACAARADVNYRYELRDIEKNHEVMRTMDGGVVQTCYRFVKARAGPHEPSKLLQLPMLRTRTVTADKPVPSDKEQGAD
jgi:malonyl-CoA decarboxylase